MFPYDFESDSIWEADNWRERPSDGELVLFQTEGPIKALRAINEKVYPGVRLDRTVVLAGQWILDVFRALSDQEHCYDWAVHCPGDLDTPGPTRSAGLGDRRGYRHLAEVREVTGAEGVIALRWGGGGQRTDVQLEVPHGGRILLARDPEVEPKQRFGETESAPRLSTVVVRLRSRQALFLSLWRWGGVEEALLERRRGAADGDLDLSVRMGDASTALRVPFASGPVDLIR
jgi:hypothetical protein